MQNSNIVTNELQKKVTNIYHTRRLTKKIGKPNYTEISKTKFTTSSKTKYENDQVSLINQVQKISQVKKIYDYQDNETSGKKIINKTDKIVLECLKSNAMLMKGVRLLPEGNIIVCKEIDQTKISLLCVGGFDHHPMPCQYVAKGMLTGAATGVKFGESPTFECIMKLIYNSHSKAGVLLIVNNNQESLHYCMLAVQAAYSLFDTKVELVVVNDDISNKNKIVIQNAIKESNNENTTDKICKKSNDSTYCSSGIVLLIKVLGAAAEKGMNLSELLSYGNSLLKNMATTSVSIYPNSLPNQSDSFYLHKNEIFIGNPSLLQKK